MELRRDFLLAVGALVALNVLLSFGAIGLFTRMTPVIEKILQENVFSNEAAEEMLAVLAESRGTRASDTDRQRFTDALTRAQANVTEQEEVPVLQRIETEAEAALSGSAGAAVSVVRDLQRLIGINRRAMGAVDREAQRLGTAGAWTSVFIAAITLVISAVVISRLQKRIVSPLVELDAVLAAAHGGDRHRRCRVPDASVEMRRILSSVNVLLDRDLRSHTEESPARDYATAVLERAALLHFLEREPAPTLLIDDRGEIVAANIQGLAAGHSAAVKKKLARIATAERGSEDAGAVPLPGTKGWLCALPSAPAGA